MLIYHLAIFLGDMSSQFLPFSNWIFCLLLSFESTYILDISPFLDMWLASIFSHFVVFRSLHRVFCRAKDFNCDEVVFLYCVFGVKSKFFAKVPFFAYGSTIAPGPFIAKTIFLQLNCCHTFVKNQLGTFVWV